MRNGQYMNIKMLGSGDWQGTPAVFCTCRVCMHAAANPKSPEYRTRPSLHISTKTTDILVEASPDLRLQSALHRLPDIRHILISHWHFDHMFGLYELHAWVELFAKDTTIYCSKATANKIKTIFSHIQFNVVTLEAYRPFEIGDVRIIPLPVRHMQQDIQTAEEHLDNTLGFQFESAERKVAYLADYFQIPDRTRTIISNCDTAVLDGTYLFEDKYPNKPYQRAIVKDYDADHLHGHDIIAYAASLKTPSVVYHSVSHLSELMHDELQELLPKNQFIGKDGYVL